jgi:cytidylate kinase
MPASSRPRIPVSLTITISREAGARGASIAQRVGTRLGWQVYTQELLEYSLQNELMRQDILDSLTPEASAWVDAQLHRVIQGNIHSHDNSFRDLVQMILALGAQGEVILIGRGAGHILPRPTTFSLRLVAPLADRVAYFSQWLRLPQQEAEQQVRQRDQRRNEFIERHFRQSPADVHLYDLVVNTAYIGEDLSVELITQAARARLSALFSEPEESAPVA